MAEIHILDKPACDMIHRTSINILNDIGFIVQGKNFLRLLEKAGAKVIDGRVKFSEKQVLHAIESAPKQFSVGDRKGGSFILGDNSQHITSSTCDSLRYRCRDGRIRQSFLKDFIQTVRLCDALPEIEIVRSPAVPNDYDGLDRDIVAIGAILSNTTKHVWMSATAINNARCWFKIIDMLQDQIMSNLPAFSVLICPTSPFILNDVICFVIEQGSRRGLPFICASMPIAGATAPITLAGTLTVANAESLFLLTCIQAIQTGSPFVYGPFASVLEMATGAFCCAGPERILLGLGATQMAQYYNLPSYFSIGHTESVIPDIQAGSEQGIGLFTAVNSNASVVGSVGSLAKALVLSPEEILIGIEIIRAVRYMQKGISVNNETIAYETIAKVGAGGHFLEAEHTLRHLRGSEIFHSRLFNRDNIDTNPPSMLDRAGAIVDELINREPHVPKNQLEMIGIFMKERMGASKYENVRSNKSDF